MHVAHPVSDRIQPCLSSVKLMELAGPLGHSPRSPRSHDALLSARQFTSLRERSIMSYTNSFVHSLYTESLLLHILANFRQYSDN